LKQEIKDLYNEQILDQALALYGLEKSAVTDLGGFESFIYSFDRDGRGYILKITHSLRRSINYISGELEWLNYLADHGVSVARAIPAMSGRLVEAIPHGNGDDHFITIAYERAAGHRPEADDWNAALFETWGREMGKIHRFTKDYQVSNPAFKRQEWYEEEHLKVASYIPADQTLVYERAAELMTRIQSFPKDRDSYGLAHTDCHHGNLLVDASGAITLFDFDDCGYNWFVNDVAIVLYYAMLFPAREYTDKSAFAGDFLTHFLRGYRQENNFDRAWLARIPDFLRLRHVLMYVVFHQAFDLTTADADTLGMVQQFRTDIESGAPIVDFDFTTL